MLKTGDKLADVLMRPLNFHDGEVLKVILERIGPTLIIDVLVTADLSLREFQRPPISHESPYIITIRFVEVEDFRLENFNHQNVIHELVLGQEQDRLKVEIPSLFGGDISLTCSTAEIIGVEPTHMRLGRSLDPQNVPESGEA